MAQLMGKLERALRVPASSGAVTEWPGVPPAIKSEGFGQLLR
jgi:hypothetical protein